MPSRLAETNLAQSWLNQFDPEERPDARLLLESLKCISASGFQNELQFLLDAIKNTYDAPIAVYAAREITNDECYFPDKNRRPNVILNNIVGSEGTTAYVANALAEGDSSTFLYHPPIQTLRRRRCHHIVIIDDIIGSGKRVRDFIRSMHRTDSIRSWWSFGWIKFHVVAYGISDAGKDLISNDLKGNRRSQGIEFHDSGRLITAEQTLDSVSVQRIKMICRSYGNKYHIPRFYTTGFGKRICTAVFSHRCPNNAPGILWCTRNGWQPLFPNRAIPVELSDCFHEEVPTEHPSVLSNSFDPLVIQSPSFLKGSHDERIVLLVLSAIRKKIRTVKGIASVTDLPASKVSYALNICKHFRLIDDQILLTENGRDGLRRAEQQHIIEPQGMSENEFYFPTALRGGQEAI